MMELAEALQARTASPRPACAPLSEANAAPFTMEVAQCHPSATVPETGP